MFNSRVHVANYGHDVKVTGRALSVHVQHEVFCQEAFAEKATILNAAETI